MLSAVLVSAPIYPYFINNPVDLGNWLRGNFSYENEEKEYWKTPEETIGDKKGDCEDFAFLAQRVLTDLGYEAYTIMLVDTRNNVGHAICLFKETDGSLSIFDNYLYIPHKAKDFNSILKKDYSEYNRQYLCSFSGTCRNIVTKKIRYFNTGRK